MWVIDFEFQQLPGENPLPHCVVAYEIRSKRTVKMELNGTIPRDCPFQMNDGVLFVGFFSCAEWACFLALDWPLPRRVLDLYVEFRNLLSGRKTPAGYGLSGALVSFGLDSLRIQDKEQMRELAIRGAPFTTEERIALLDYCERDVMATVALLDAMLEHLDLPRALYRGRYMVALAKMEREGVPIDTELLLRLRSNWGELRLALVEEHDPHGIWDGARFNEKRFAEFLALRGISWPTTASGRLCLDKATFKTMSILNPVVAPIRTLRQLMSNMRLESLSVGGDGRNRVMLSPFQSKTGRNQPSNARFIYGQPKWLHFLIRPEPTRALAYIDYCQQEFGIGAALSGDVNMMRAYSSEDPYLGFARQAGERIERLEDAEVRRVRARYKQAVLAVQYGMSSIGLATCLGEELWQAEELLRLHRKAFPSYWQMTEQYIDHAVLCGWVRTVFGWYLHVEEPINRRSIMNFPMQANGSEILRLACCELTEVGINVCAPVHDAVLVEGPLEDIDEIVSYTKEILGRVSRIVLGGFELKTDVVVIRYPQRVEQPGGSDMFHRIMRTLTEVETR
jgi:hypothetical protein